MITHFNVVYTAESLRRCFGDDLDLARQPPRLVPADGPHRRADDVATTARSSRATRSRAAPTPGRSRPTSARCGRTSCSACPGCGRRSTPASPPPSAADPEKKKQFDEGVAAAIPIAIDRSWGRATAEQDATWDFLQDVAFRPVRELVGLDQVEFAITGAAPIPGELLEWYQAIGVPLSEIYGMSESSGPMTWTPDRLKPGTVGPAIPGCEVVLADDGEVICRGGNVFDGYLDAPDKTAEALDRTAGSTPATSARSTTTATSRSSTARRS